MGRINLNNRYWHQRNLNKLPPQFASGAEDKEFLHIKLFVPVNLQKVTRRAPEEEEEEVVEEEEEEEEEEDALQLFYDEEEHKHWGNLWLRCGWLHNPECV